MPPLTKITQFAGESFSTKDNVRVVYAGQEEGEYLVFLCAKNPCLLVNNFLWYSRLSILSEKFFGPEDKKSPKIPLDFI
jgi:hypothetical protein